jgi:hypothetical protein
MIIHRKPWTVHVPISQSELLVFNETGTLPLHLDIADIEYMKHGIAPHATNSTVHNWLRSYCCASPKQLESIKDAPCDEMPETDLPTKKGVRFVDLNTGEHYIIFDVNPFEEIAEITDNWRKVIIYKDKTLQ